ncbi:MAG: hypothetical protein ACREF4_10265 [Gammaproteobacteria bacterium]
MADDAVWRLGTWEGNRRRQHEEFRALPLREKIAVIEQLAEVTELFAARRRARGLAVSGPEGRTRESR